RYPPVTAGTLIDVGLILLILGIVLIVAGVGALLRKQVLWGIALIVIGLIVAPRRGFLALCATASAPSQRRPPAAPGRGLPPRCPRAERSGRAPLRQTPPVAPPRGHPAACDRPRPPPSRPGPSPRRPGICPQPPRSRTVPPGRARPRSRGA